MTTPLDPMRLALGAQPVQPAGIKPAEAARTEDGKSFGDVLQDFVKQVDTAQHQFDDAIAAVERGETDNMHRVMLAQNEAQL
ncbi:MAG TPA: flagellar hook-basal body complex protein FliE, partial [Planctomycetota bacterium]|nr:flagellar hook-basal body complex protein FliE [Planctomycetota bacterium]